MFSRVKFVIPPPPPFKINVLSVCMSEKYNLQRHEKGQTLAKKPIFKHCLYIKLYEFVYRMRAHAETQKILLLISSSRFDAMLCVYYTEFTTLC